jgi:hypothetical protein
MAYVDSQPLLQSECVTDFKVVRHFQSKPFTMTQCNVAKTRFTALSYRVKALFQNGAGQETSQQAAMRVDVLFVTYARD